MASPQPALDVATRAALDKLANIAVPSPVPWTPQTWGWAILAILLVAVCAWAYLHWRRRREANRYRDEALAELAQLEARFDHPAERAEALAAVPALLKRTALAAWPRTAVASLSGSAWVEFMREHCGGAGLPPVAVEFLEHGEYRTREELAAMTLDQARVCSQAARAWIEGHRVSA